jgi:hypothetical protein
MQASTQLDSRRGYVPRGGSAACEHVARRWGHIGGRGAGGRGGGSRGCPPAVPGGGETHEPGATAGAESGPRPPGPPRRAWGEPSLHPWHARRER